MSVLEKLAMLGAAERAAKGDYQTALKAGYANESDEELRQKRKALSRQVAAKTLGGAAGGALGGYLVGSRLTKNVIKDFWPGKLGRREKKAAKQVSRIGGAIVGAGGGLVGLGIGALMARRARLARKMRAAEEQRRAEAARD